MSPEEESSPNVTTTTDPPPPFAGPSKTPGGPIIPTVTRLRPGFSLSPACFLWLALTQRHPAVDAACKLLTNVRRAILKLRC